MAYTDALRKHLKEDIRKVANYARPILNFVISSETSDTSAFHLEARANSAVTTLRPWLSPKRSTENLIADCGLPT